MSKLFSNPLKKKPLLKWKKFQTKTPISSIGKQYKINFVNVNSILRKIKNVQSTINNISSQLFNSSISAKQIPLSSIKKLKINFTKVAKYLQKAKINFNKVAKYLQKPKINFNKVAAYLQKPKDNKYLQKPKINFNNVAKYLQKAKKINFAKLTNKEWKRSLKGKFSFKTPYVAKKFKKIFLGMIEAYSLDKPIWWLKKFFSLRYKWQKNEILKNPRILDKKAALKILKWKREREIKYLSDKYIPKYVRFKYKKSYGAFKTPVADLDYVAEVFMTPEELEKYQTTEERLDWLLDKGYIEPSAQGDPRLYWCPILECIVYVDL